MHIWVATSPSSRLLVNLFLLSGRSRSPTRSRTFSFFAYSIGPCRYVLIPISSLNPPYISTCFSSFTLFLSASFSLSSIFSYTSVLHLPNFSIDSTSSWFSPKSFHIFSTTSSNLDLFQLSPFCYFLLQTLSAMAGNLFPGSIYFILPFQLSHASLCFKWVHS